MKEVQKKPFTTVVHRSVRPSTITSPVQMDSKSINHAQILDGITEIARKQGWYYRTFQAVGTEIRERLGLKRPPLRPRYKAIEVPPESIQRFWQCIENSQDIRSKALLTVMFYTGMGPGELTNLKEKDIQINKDCITIKREKNSAVFAFYSDPLKELLQVYLKQLSRKKQQYFLNSVNKSSAMRIMQRFVKKHIIEAGIPEIASKQFPKQVTRWLQKEGRIPNVPSHS